MTSSALPIILCLISAVTVAGVNVFVKKGGDVMSTRMVVAVAMAACALPFAPFVPLPTSEVWLALCVSVMVHWFYQFSLVRSLHRGDLSLVFPVMRGLAPLLTAILANLFLFESPGIWGWAGLMLATAALIVFAMPEGQTGVHLKLRRDALLWAILTAFGIAAYAVADTRGMRLAEASGSRMSFIVWLFLLDWIGITFAMAVSRRGRMWQDLKPQIRAGFLAGGIGAVSYSAALWAYTLSEAANVTAIRETSVVFGALFGAIFLKESFSRRRIAAAAVLATGLMLLEFAP